MVPPAADNPNPNPTNTKNPNTFASTAPTGSANTSKPHPSIINPAATNPVSKNRSFLFGFTFTAPASTVPIADAASIGSSNNPARKGLAP
jgi:hypothetical protein